MTKVFWTVRIPVLESEQESIKAYARELGSSCGAIVGACVSAGIARGIPELMEDHLVETKSVKAQHPGYSRRKADPTKPRRPIRRKLVVVSGERSEEHADQSLNGVLQQMGIDSAGRDEQFEEVLRFIEWPGDCLDEKCEDALANWEDMWGELTEQERQRLSEARKKRQEAYDQWQDLHRSLLSRIHEEKTREKETASKPKLSRKHRIRRLKLEADLQAFESKVQWTERPFAKNKQGAP